MPTAAQRQRQRDEHRSPSCRQQTEWDAARAAVGELEEVDERFGFNIFLRDGDDVYRTYFLQHGPMVQQIGSVWTMCGLTPYGGQSGDEDSPEGWP